MQPIDSTRNPFGGVLTNPAALDADPITFTARLRSSLDAWKKEGLRVVWLEVPIVKSQLTLIRH